MGNSGSKKKPLVQVYQARQVEQLKIQGHTCLVIRDTDPIQFEWCGEKRCRNRIVSECPSEESTTDTDTSYRETRGN